MKILVVDNNPVILRVMTAFLADDLGHQVQTAADGLAALHLLDEFTPEVVITDLVMPNIGGDKLCRIIRDLPQLSHCYIVILSAIAAEESPGTYQADAIIAKGRAGEVKKHLQTVLDQVGRHKSDQLYEVDLTLGLDQMHDREVTRELLDSRNYYAAIIEQLEEGVFGLSLNGEIIHVNRAACRLTGQSEEKLLSREFAKLFTAPNQALVRRELQEMSHGKVLAPRQLDSDPPLHVNGYYVILRCLPLEVDGRRAILVIMRDQSDQVISNLVSHRARHPGNAGGSGPSPG